MNKQKDAGLYRVLPDIGACHEDSTLEMSGQQQISLCSNDYLGLSLHPALNPRNIAAWTDLPAGSSGSRLITGNHPIHRKLEQAIATFLGTEAALLFGSGYLANVGIISALMDSHDVIFSDELNHASIIDGCRLSRAQVRVFAHNDLNQLEDHLRAANTSAKKLIVVESVYSMDGDSPALPELIRLKEKYGAILMVDEAHALGVRGPSGKGCLWEKNLLSQTDILIGTFGKAFGSYGAFAAGSSDLVDFLKNRARSFIFSTALPPLVSAINLAALPLVRDDEPRRARLWENVRLFHAILGAIGFAVPAEASHIIPLITGDVAITMAMAAQLRQSGIFVQGIRPPTVPPRKSRIRLTINASLTRQQLEFAGEKFDNVGKSLHLV
jgi:8-amino-7-oxononanoate synthase